MRMLAVTALVLGLAAPAAGQDMGARSGEQDAGMSQGKTASRRTPDPRMTDSRNPRSPGAGGAGGAGSGRGSAGSARAGGAGDAGRSDPAKAPSPGPADPTHNGVPSQTEKAKDARRPADTPSR